MEKVSSGTCFTFAGIFCISRLMKKTTKWHVCPGSLRLVQSFCHEVAQMSTWTFQGTPQGWYAYAASTLGNYHDTTSLYTPKIGATGPQCKLNFFYNMAGPNVDSIHVLVTANGIISQLWAVSGGHGMVWRQASVFIGARSSAIISIQARRGTSYQGAIAIDDVQFIDCQPPLVSPTSCVTTQFECANKYCIDKSKQCDYANDCGDSSDEYVSWHWGKFL